MKKSAGKLAPGRLATLKEINCERCKKLFTKNSPTQRFCGSKTLKTGCSYETHKENCRVGAVVRTLADPITEAEVNDASLYEKYFKENCVGCGGEIPATWTNYKVRGNYCLKCSVKAHLSAKLHGSAY